MRHTQTVTALVAIVMFCSFPVFGDGPEPLTVSPGATDSFTGVENRCPTFSWQAAPGAAWHELVVYELPPGFDPATASMDGAVEVLFAELPGGVMSWTPPLESGLAPGADHAWFVRAIFDAEGLDSNGESQWSSPRFFHVAAPTPVGVDEALRVLSAYISAGGELEAEVDAGAVPARSGDAGRRRGDGAADRKLSGARVKDVGTAMAAIRGEAPDPTGETYGVVGISNSPDGAGLGAVNTAGGADLVLDGSADGGTADGETDTAISQSGIDRASPGVETFSIANTGGGGIDLTVQGEVSASSLNGDGSGLTSVNAETLDGLDATAFALTVHLHDGRYYTETELNTSGGGGAVHWDNLTEVPAGLDDGDDDTTYAFGYGLVLVNGVVSMDPTFLLTRISTLDSTGDVGEYTSIAIGADGLGLISYYDHTNGDLKVAHCNDTGCASAATTTLDSTGDVGRYTSIAIGADGLGLISYCDLTNQDLKVAVCDNALCTSATTTTLDSTGDVGFFTSIAIGADGLGLISYSDLPNDDLKVAHCDNALCASATTTTLDSTGDVGFFTSIAIGADGLGLISYHDLTNQDLKVAHCDNALCNSATTTTLDSGGDVGHNTSIAIGADGLGLISYFDNGLDDLKVAHCDNTLCTSATTTTLDSTGYVGRYTSITIGADGLGLISYQGTNQDLKVAHCDDTACTSAATATLDSGGAVGLATSIVLGADGLGLISYFDHSNYDLKAAHLGIGVP